MDKEFDRHFSKHNIQMENKKMKTFCTSLVIKEVLIKTTMRCHFMSTKMGIIINQKNSHASKCW